MANRRPPDGPLKFPAGKLDPFRDAHRADEAEALTQIDVARATGLSSSGESDSEWKALIEAVPPPKASPLSTSAGPTPVPRRDSPPPRAPQPRASPRQPPGLHQWPPPPPPPRQRESAPVPAPPPVPEFDAPRAGAFAKAGAAAVLAPRSSPGRPPGLESWPPPPPPPRRSSPVPAPPPVPEVTPQAMGLLPTGAEGSVPALRSTPARPPGLEVWPAPPPPPPPKSPGPGWVSAAPADHSDAPVVGGQLVESSSAWAAVPDEGDSVRGFAEISEPPPPASGPAPGPEPRPQLQPLGARSPNQDPNTAMGRVFPDKIYRFRRSERLLHWCIALPFLVCLASAAVLFFVYNKNPLLPYRVAVSWVHRIAGAALLALPPLAILLKAKDIKVHLANIREGWSWSFDDIRWLALMPLSVLSKRVKLPEEGKFNAGEKLNFMASMGSYLVMGATGIFVWNDPLALAAWLVHLATAAALVPLIGGHIFMATVNPSSRVGLSGMTSGWVSRTWASHHYRRWYGQMLVRHLQQHGKVPELDTSEQDEPLPDEDPRRRRSTRLRWLVAGSVLGLAVASGIGVTTYALRGQLAALRSTLHLDTAALASTSSAAGPQNDAAPAPSTPVPPPVAACSLAPEETGPEPCEARAKAVAGTCAAACPESRKAVCSDICEEQRVTCVEECRRAAAPPAAAAAEPRPKPAKSGSRGPSRPRR